MRGEGPVVIEYMDFECPHCAQAHAKLAGLEITRVFRHFPVTSKHPRARVLAHAAEAAALQGRFWEFHDSLYEDHGRLDDPHLWERCKELGLDLERFEADRRWTPSPNGSSGTSTAASARVWPPRPRCSWAGRPSRGCPRTPCSARCATRDLAHGLGRKVGARHRPVGDLAVRRLRHDLP